MDTLDLDNVKAEKAKALLMFHRLRAIGKLFRLVEVLSTLLLLSWISPRVPLAVKIFGEYLRRLIAVILSPLFVFLISNAIVITLLAKSGRAPAVDNAETDIYEEFIKTSHNGAGNQPPVPEPEAIVYDDKEIISISEVIISVDPKRNEVAVDDVRVSDFKSSFERSKSEKLTGKSSWEKPCGKLRRSETEKCGRVVDSGEDPAAGIVEELSNEEFQRTIEEFIAKQVKFHKEEKLAIVVKRNPNPNPNHQGGSE